MDFEQLIKLVYIDGNLHEGPTKSVIGHVVSEDEFTISIRKKDTGKVITIGKCVLVKIIPVNGGSR